MIDVNIYHSGLIRTFLSHSVNDVICKVELILIFKMNCAEYSFVAGLALYELLGNGVQQTCLVNICKVVLCHLLMVLRHTCSALRRHYEGVYLAVLTAESHLVMGHRAVVVDTVALMEYLCMRTDSHTQSSPDNDIHFLTGMACHMQRL